MLYDGQSEIDIRSIEHKDPLVSISWITQLYIPDSSINLDLAFLTLPLR
jgi:hypothetical protein